MTLLAYSHTPFEDQLYRAMLTEVSGAAEPNGAFSVKRLAALTGISSVSTIRRALAGLLRKSSIESIKAPRRERSGKVYQVFRPAEIFERRRANGVEPFPEAAGGPARSPSFQRAVERVVLNNRLSRREAQVALACVEGLTNAEIGRRLSVGEQTVKFHLRNIFTKFGVKRRTELISRLLVPEERSRAQRGSQAGEIKSGWTLSR